MTVNLTKTPAAVYVAHHVADTTPPQSNADIMAGAVTNVKANRLAVEAEEAANAPSPEVAERARLQSLTRDGRHEVKRKADALHIINAMPRTARFYLHVRIDGELPANRCIPDLFSASLRITRTDAEAMVNSMMSDATEARGATLALTIHAWDCRAKVASAPPQRQRVVWIG